MFVRAYVRLQKSRMFPRNNMTFGNNQFTFRQKNRLLCTGSLCVALCQQLLIFLFCLFLIVTISLIIEFTLIRGSILWMFFLQVSVQLHDVVRRWPIKSRLKSRSFAYKTRDCSPKPLLDYNFTKMLLIQLRQCLFTLNMIYKLWRPVSNAVWSRDVYNLGMR